MIQLDRRDKFGQYKVKDYLGQGNFGTVLLVKNKSNNVISLDFPIYFILCIFFQQFVNYSNNMR